MKRFLLRFGLFAILFCGTLAAITAFTDQRLRSRNKGRMRSWYAIAHGNVNADILIFGSSHAHVQVDPRLLQSVFPGKLIYNLGLEGYTFDMQLARYEFYLRHNKKPEAIIFCVDYTQFAASSWNVDQPQFLPYLYDSSINKRLQAIGMERYKAWLPFLKYRGEANVVAAAFGNTSPLPDDAHDRRSWSGFESVKAHWNESAFVSDTVHKHYTPVVDSPVWQSFCAFTAKCRQTGTQLYFVFTPHQTRFVAKMAGAGAYRYWLKARLWPYALIDFSNTVMCHDTSLFYNGTHMNEKGAEIFSASLADSLRIKKTIIH